MVQRQGGIRRKTRAKLSKHFRKKGKVSLRNSLQEFAIGAHVALAAEPAVQSGMYHPRFHGQTGIVQKKQGSCYVVRITDGKKKDIVIHPVHLKKA